MYVDGVEYTDSKRKAIIAWLDDAHDAMEGAITYLNRTHGDQGMRGSLCLLPGCGDCGLRRDLQRLIGGEDTAWPNCRACNGTMDEASKYAGIMLCSACYEDNPELAAKDDRRER
jgi:hypothetical protein